MSFTMATYNILADAYVRPEWYPLTPGHLLNPASRRSALLSHLVEIGTDLLCLQEVEQATFAAIEARLEPLGYKGFFSQKARRRPDGCATLYRKAVFALSEAGRLEYADAQPGREQSGHVAQLLSLEHEAGRVGIANTHLKWDPPGTPISEQYGYQQAAQLLRERDQQVSGCTAWIICGDLNTTPDSDVIAMIQRTGLKFTHAGYPDAYTANTNGRAKTIDYLFHSEALCAEPLPLPPVGPQTALPGSIQPSDHVAVVARFTWN